MKTAFDIIIVGGGMVGAALAAKLACDNQTQGLSIAVVDAGGEPEQFSGESFDPRVVALSKKSEALLQAIEVWPAVVNERACAYQSMDIWDAEGTGNIQFYAQDVHQYELGHIVENSVVVRQLRARLQQLESVTLLGGARVTGYARTETTTTLDVQLAEENRSIQLTASLVVAADGAKSPMRELAGLKTREWDYGHTAIVTTIRSEKAHDFCCWQRFTTEGPIAFLPLQHSAQPEQHYCSLVWSAKHELADELMQLSDTDFCARLAREFEHRLGAVESSAKRFALPLRQRHLVNYIAEGFAAVGDAAHTIHPLAGQGVNLGFYDVDALAEELSRACERSVPLSDSSILRRYQRKRKSQNLTAMASMEGFKRLFASDDLILRWARNTGMSFVNNQLFLKKQLAQIAAG